MAIPGSEETKQPSGLVGEFKQTFRSFEHQNFRRYFFGYCVSLCGTWMQNLALSWLVYKMTNSAFLLGMVEFANLSPVLLLGLFAGSVADRFDRRKILICTQTALMLQAAVLAFLTITNQIQLWHIFVLASFAGVVVAFELPARQSLIVNLVDKTNLVNAISLNSSMFNGTRVIGPAVAALLIRFTGEGACFAVNAVSYLAALIALFMIRIPPREIVDTQNKTGVMEGLTYAFQSAEIRRILRLTALLTLFGAQFTVLLPVVAREVLHHDVEGFGALRAAASVGSLIAALGLANRGSGEMLKNGVGIAGVAFGAALIVFSLSTDFWVSTTFAVLLGFAMTFQHSGCHSLLQLGVPDRLRGRLMSVWTMTIMGMSPLGSLLIGWAAHTYGAPHTLLISAIIGLVSAVIYLWLKV
jgi:MFS family permease